MRPGEHAIVGDNFLPIIGASTIVITIIYPLTTCLVPLGKKVKKNIFCVLYSTVNNIAIKFISPKLILFDISTLHHATNQEIEYFYIVAHRHKVSLLGVDSLWGDCTFIPADWGS